MATKKKIERILTFDIMRGYFLIGILSDHLTYWPNGLDWWSARGGLFVTMAEGFFLISGIILGIVRGAKLVDQPFRNVAKLLLKRGGQLYVVSVVLALLFTFIGWMFYIGNPGLKTGIANPSTSILGLIWDTLTLQYLYGWADYLRLYAIFLFFSPIVMWLLRRGWWYVALAASLGVWALFPDTNVATYEQQEKLQVLSWQLIFYGGMIIGFYWPKILDKWRSLEARTRQIVATSVVSLAAVTLAYNVAIMLQTMGHDMSWLGIGPSTQQNLYVLFFDKERLPPPRLALFMLWFWAAFYLFRRFEPYIKRFMGWLLIPIGINSLYVYTVEAFLLFFAHIYLPSGSLIQNFVIIASLIGITLFMVRKRILMKIIPR